MAKETPELLTIEEAVALLINFDCMVDGVSLSEMLLAFYEDAKEAHAVGVLEELHEDELVDLTRRIILCDARFALADSFTSALEKEVENIKSDFESDIELHTGPEGERITASSLSYWAAYNYGIDVPTKQDGFPLGTSWKDITIKLKVNDRIEVSCRGKKSITKSLYEVGFMGKNKSYSNREFGVLVGLAKGKKYPPDGIIGSKEKTTMSRLRGCLKRLSGIDGDPFSLCGEGVGWRPIFKLKDLRGDADARAKKAATHVAPDEGEHRPYEANDFPDDADAFIKNKLQIPDKK